MLPFRCSIPTHAIRVTFRLLWCQKGVLVKRETAPSDAVFYFINVGLQLFRRFHNSSMSAKSPLAGLPSRENCDRRGFWSLLQNAVTFSTNCSPLSSLSGKKHRGSCGNISQSVFQIDPCHLGGCCIHPALRPAIAAFSPSQINIVSRVASSSGRNKGGHCSSPPPMNHLLSVTRRIGWKYFLPCWFKAHVVAEDSAVMQLVRYLWIAYGCCGSILLECRLCIFWPVSAASNDE